MDVGSGDALLVHPLRRYLLVDGGPSPTGCPMPWAGACRWAHGWTGWSVAASGDEQLAALPPLIERSPPQQVLWAGPELGTRVPNACRKPSPRRASSPYLRDRSQPGPGRWGSAAVLASGSRGAVLLLEWGDFRALLPVGLDFEAMERLMTDPNLSTVTALLLADSGYAPANPPQWIEVLRPEVVLLSVAAGDREGRPGRRDAGGG